MTRDIQQLESQWFSSGGESAGTAITSFSISISGVIARIVEWAGWQTGIWWELLYKNAEYILEGISAYREARRWSWTTMSNVIWKSLGGGTQTLNWVGRCLERNGACFLLSNNIEHCFPPSIKGTNVSCLSPPASSYSQRLCLRPRAVGKGVLGNLRCTAKVTGVFWDSSSEWK